jgi:hypothetical protein
VNHDFVSPEGCSKGPSLFEIRQLFPYVVRVTVQYHNSGNFLIANRKSSVFMFVFIAEEGSWRHELMTMASTY